MRCKFCGCTETTPCRVPVMLDEHEPGSVTLWAGAPEEADGFLPCEWIAPEICSNPECVKKAYAEARSGADRIARALQMLPLIILPDQAGLSETEIERGLFRL